MRENSPIPPSLQQNTRFILKVGQSVVNEYAFIHSILKACVTSKNVASLPFISLIALVVSKTFF